MPQTVIDINGSGLQSRTRTNAKGKASTRYTVTIVSEPILHVFDDQRLGKGPAEAIAEVIRERIRAITQVAKPSTIAYRQRAKEALARGASWAIDRYTRGRLQGDFTPGKSNRLFNDSGRLAAGIHVQENVTEKSWTVNVPANRFDPSTFVGGESAMADMVARLQALVPELGNPQALIGHAKVQDAITESIGDLLKKAEALHLDKRRELTRAALRLFPGVRVLADLI